MIKERNTKTILETTEVNIKIENKEQIISNYSYDEHDKLNKDLADFIMTKTKRTHISQDIKLNIYTKEVIKKTEVESTIKNHFNEERLEIKEDLKRSNIFVLVMFGLGILTFAILVALYKKSVNNFYFEMVLEIAAWVFIWEAVDVLFLQRPKIRKRYMQLQKLCSARVEIVNDNKEDLKIEESKQSGKSKR